MANFRNLLLAFAGAAVFASVSANAQVLATNQALQCVANAGVPPLVRAEGLAELVGDVTLNCQGGIPTQVNAQVPATNIRVFLNTNITSRIIGGSNFSEALLMIDEPRRAATGMKPLDAVFLLISLPNFISQAKISIKPFANYHLRPIVPQACHSDTSIPPRELRRPLSFQQFGYHVRPHRTS